jgi:anticodon-binding protein
MHPERSKEEPSRKEPPGEPREHASDDLTCDLNWEEARAEAGGDTLASLLPADAGANSADAHAPAAPPRVNPFTGEDVEAILREHGWLADATTPASPEQLAWCARAAFLLGVQVADRAQLAELLSLVFHYDAAEVLTRMEAHLVMSRYAARDVLRRFALELLEDAPLTPERFSAIISAMKDTMEPRGRELFHPIRLALTGRSGEGALDRVILLLDDAANAGFVVSVKSARTRILEFCAAFV